MNDLYLISYCITCHGRTYDLKQVLPSVIEAARISHPVEIVILDYNSPDDLKEYMNSIMISENNIKYVKYTGKDYYHMAHAKNLSILSANGEYVVTSCADIFLHIDFFKIIRNIIKDTSALWIHSGLIDAYPGVVAFKKEEFIKIGGFDERFEFYGPEDKDLIERFKRCGLRDGIYSCKLLREIRTSKKDKFKNYRIKSRKEIEKLMRQIHQNNIQNNILIANPDGWGSWK